VRDEMVRERMIVSPSVPKMLLVREEFLAAHPIRLGRLAWILQALGRKAHGLSSSRADRFNYRRRQKSERHHMAYVAITHAFPVRDLFG